MVNGLRKILVSLMILILLSCQADPFAGNKDLKEDLGTLEKQIARLYKNNNTPQEIISLLTEVEKILEKLQEGRDQMTREADRLTRESYDLHSKKIDTLKKGRLELYNGIDDFIVCSYHLLDQIRSPVYYHDRHELTANLTRVQKMATALVQKDPPLSNASYSYYKNLDKITSQTADEQGGWYYTIEVNIGYNLNEKNTQTLINSSKLALGGLIRSYFSGLTRDQIVGTPEPELKAGLVMALNNHLIKFADFKNDKMEGVKLVTFDMVQTYEFH